MTLYASEDKKKRSPLSVPLSIKTRVLNATTLVERLRGSTTPGVRTMISDLSDLPTSSRTMSWLREEDTDNINMTTMQCSEGCCALLLRRRIGLAQQWRKICTTRKCLTCVFVVGLSSSSLWVPDGQKRRTITYWLGSTWRS